MKILHINLNYNVSSLYMQFSNHLIKNDCDITVYFPTIKDSKLDNVPNFLDVEPILNKYDRLFFNKRNKKVISSLEKRYDINNFAVIHAHSLFSNGYIAYSLKKKFSIPYIVAVRNTDINVFFKKLFYMRKKGIQILMEAEKIVCLSLPYKEILLEKYVPGSIQDQIREKIVVIPNGIDPYWLENKYKPKIKPQKQKLKILTVGFINKNKNSLITAKACQDLIDNYGTNIELTLVGTIQDEHYYKQIKKFECVNHIPFQKKEKLLELYRSSDIFLMPSITETFGLAYAEALSQGLPVLYTKGQGFDKQFNEGVVGYSVESNNERDIANKIRLVLKNYESLTQNCIDMVDKYSWDKISKKYIKIYNRINFINAL